MLLLNIDDESITGDEGIPLIRNVYDFKDSLLVFVFNTPSPKISICGMLFRIRASIVGCLSVKYP